jgi:regulator of sirC expression with transglutaminase-like and TPR domain
MKIKYDFIKDIIKGIAIVCVYMLTIKYPFLLFNPFTKAAVIAITIFIAVKPPFLLLKAARFIVILGAVVLAFRDPLSALYALGLLLFFIESLINGLSLFHTMSAFYINPHAYINYNILPPNNSEDNNTTLAEDENKNSPQRDSSEDIHAQDDDNYCALPCKIGKLYPIFNIIAIILSLMIIVFAFNWISSVSDIGLICLILFSSLSFLAILLIFIIPQNQITLFSDRAIVHTFWSNNTISFKDIRGIEVGDFNNGYIVRIIFLTKTRKYKVIIPNSSANARSNDWLVLLIKIVRKISPQLQINGLAEEIINNDRDLLEADRLIKLNPKDADAYNNRGVLKQTNLNDIHGALSDYNKAILLGRGSANELNPQHAYAYRNRGLIKEYNLNDIPGALADYNKAIELNPQYADAYKNRGLLKKDKLNDRTGAIEDFQEAANIYHEQDNMPSYRDAINRLKELGINK